MTLAEFSREIMKNIFESIWTEKPPYTVRHNNNNNNNNNNDNIFIIIV
jgi:hypothetical protein